MKTIAKIALLLILSGTTISALSSNKIKGNSNTEMGKYIIEESDIKVEHKGKQLETYTLCYENCEKSMLIGIEELENCKNFIVVFDDMKIVYACQNGVFGVQKLPKQKTTKHELKQAIDRQQFYYQKVITQKPKTEKELLALIACYYPQLIEEDYLINHT